MFRRQDGDCMKLLKLFNPIRVFMKSKQLANYFLLSLKIGCSRKDQAKLYYLFVRWQLVDLLPFLKPAMPVPETISFDYQDAKNIRLTIARDITFTAAFRIYSFESSAVNFSYLQSNTKNYCNITAVVDKDQNKSIQRHA